MASQQLASYRLVALTFNGESPDLKAVVSAGRTAVIYAEAPLVGMTAYRHFALVSSTLNVDLRAVISSARMAFIVMAPTVSISSGRMAFIIEQQEAGTPTYVTQNYQQALQRTEYLPVGSTISRESVGQTIMLATIKSPDLPFLWSYTRTRQLYSLTMQSLPITAQSWESVAQVRQLTASAQNYIIPGDVISSERAAQSVVLVCQSIDIPYQPTSGEYVPQSRVLVMQAAEPMPIWTSPAYLRQNAMLVAQKRPIERLPRSYVSVNQNVTMAMVKRPVEQLPRSDEFAGQVVTQAMQHTVMPEPTGVIHAAQSYALAAVATEMPAAIGVIHDAQVVTTVMQSSPLPMHQSNERVTQLITMAVVGVTYPAPDEMVYLHVAQEWQAVMQQASYPPVEVQSYTFVPQVAVAFMTEPPASVYPDPQVVYENSRKAFVPQFTEQVMQGRALTMPISYVPVPQAVQTVSQHIDYPTPEEMATSGIFARQAVEHVALEAVYPSTGIPASFVNVHQVTEQLAVVAVYPDAHLPVNFAEVFQVTEQVACIETYPDPASLSAPMNVLQVTEYISFESQYPDAGALHSPVIALQLVEQLSVTAGYPDKDVPQSLARAAQITQQVAFSAAYPDKDKPQSAVRVNQVCHHVARRDLTMYQLPVPPRRHRVRIVCRFVY